MLLWVAILFWRGRHDRRRAQVRREFKTLLGISEKYSVRQLRMGATRCSVCGSYWSLLSLAAGAGTVLATAAGTGASAVSASARATISATVPATLRAYARHVRSDVACVGSRLFHSLDVDKSGYVDVNELYGMTERV
eukprot:3941768-Rhodomonas_salina.2